MSTLNIDTDERVQSLLFHSALLSGVGADAHQIANRLYEDCVASDIGRTCIDGGGRLMFSLITPGSREMRVLIRQGSECGGAVTHWLRSNVGAAETARSITFHGEIETAWSETLTIAQMLGLERRLRAYHAVLGPLSRIYTVMYTAHCARVGWQIDRGWGVDKVLANMGLPGLWKQTLDLLQPLFLFTPSATVGPWSIAHELAHGEEIVRIGTSAWARVSEDTGKSQRLAALINQLGGDGRYAEALYKLVASASPANARIGRALEIEFRQGQFTGMEFYLSLSEPRPGVRSISPN